MLLNLVTRPAKLLSAFAPPIQTFVDDLIAVLYWRALDLSSYIPTCADAKTGPSVCPNGKLA